MNSDRVTFSQATAADFDELVTLRIAAMRESLERVGRFDPERARERLRNSFYPEHTQFIVLEGERVGFYTLRPMGDLLRLDHLYVQPKHQSLGIGSAVLQKIMAEADEQQLPMHLGALRESASNRFYQRHGFVQTHEDAWDIYYVRPPKVPNHFTDWIETPRTHLRPFEETDADNAFEWFSDAEVMQFIPGGPDATLADTRRRITGYREHQTRFGFSKRLILHRETGAAIGDSGLFYLPDGKRIELGFRLAKPYWGAGYAVEVGQAWLEWFDQNFVGNPLFADVHPDHVRSQRVLEKLGFRQSHSEEIHGMPMLIYTRR